MKKRTKAIDRWKLALATMIFAVITLLWLEWLGSEQLHTQTELPVSPPTSTLKTGLKFDR